MPHEIKVGEVYETKDGLRVEIVYTDKKGEGLPIIGVIDYGLRQDVAFFSKDGRSSIFGESAVDLVLPQRPYDNWKVDDPIWVWDDQGSSDAVPSHFAGVGEDGRVKAWANGLTSHSAAIHDGRTYLWDHASKTDPRR